MSRLGVALQKAVEWIGPERDRVLADWVRAVADVRGIAESDARPGCARSLSALLERLAAGDVEGFLGAEASRAQHEARRGASLLGDALEIRVLDRCLASVLVRVCPDKDALAETLVALDELGDRRLEALLAAQEDESGAAAAGRAGARRARGRAGAGGAAGERGAAARRSGEPPPRVAAGARLVGGAPDRARCASPRS